jgi:hypothetical protein
MEPEAPQAWVMHGKWQKGEISDGEYADYLEEVSPEGDVGTEIVIKYLRRDPLRRRIEP